MESRRSAPQARYVRSGDLPDGEDIVPIRTRSGDLILVLDREVFSERAARALNACAQHILGVGLAEIRENRKPPERKE